MAGKTGVADVVDRPYWREAEARIVVEAWRNSGEALSLLMAIRDRGILTT